MVMATFSPQYVGREFVRQYYTMLHKDPMQLHRFYMKHSLFTHGSCQNGRSDEPVIGQEAIHSKICQLNFRDCYAKIKSVDSHPTINGGVVVQVTGELSNRSLPMRRFMQTFVLAPQAPKKYYVYNDIFRYQDEMFEETENEETGEGTGGEYESEGEEAIVPEPLAESALDDEISTEFERIDEPTSTFSELEDSQASLVNGGMGINEDGEMEEEELDTENESSELEEVVVDIPQDLQDPIIQDNIEYNEEPEDLPEDSQPVFEELETEPEPLQEDELIPEHVDITPEVPPLEPEGPPKPVTWAAMAKKNTPTSPPQPVAAAPRIVPKQPPPPAPQPAALPPRPQRRRDEFVKRDVGEGRRRKFSGPPPDSHQIFIGNLPNNISEADVRSLFQEYGNIVEVRLNAKNFGFVAFDAPEPASQILNRSKPIMFGKQTINIEEKRSSGSAGPRGGPRRDRDFGGRMRNDSGSRGGGGRSGPPGGPRNGPPRGGGGGGPSGPQKSKGDDGRNDGRNNGPGPRNRDRGGPGGKR